MDTTEKLIVKKRISDTEPGPPPLEKNRSHGAALGWGLMAGLFMALYLLFLQMAGAGDSIGLKFLKYAILAGFLGWGLSRYRKQDRTGKFFQRGISLGALITLYAAATLVAAGLLIGAVAPEWAFEKFSLTVDSPGDLLVTNVAIFFEILVLGMVINFIWLQYLKNKPTADLEKK